MATGSRIAGLLLCGLLGFFGLIPLEAARATPLGPPRDAPILTISGKIKVTNLNGIAAFDRGMLEALGTVSIETKTPWHRDTVKFEGVTLNKLLERVGATGSLITAVALNDYSVEIPVSDFEKFGTILALKRDGEYMPVRDKGPLFIVYPYDAYPELKSQIYYGRSAWQVAKLIVH